MAFNNIVPPYVFAIDTDQYAGNFERQMVGYITGQFGECGVGKSESDVFWDDFAGDPILISDDETIFDDVVSLPDHNGCCRPATIWPTPGWFNDGMGGHYQDGQEEEAQKEWVRKCIREANDPGSLHPANHQEHKERWLEQSKKSMTKYPAYQSVAVLWGDKPCETAIEIMIKRSHRFCSSYVKTTSSGVISLLRPYIKILGFRLIYQQITSEVINTYP